MTNTKTPQLPKWLEAPLIFILGILVFVFILVNRYPFPLRPIAIQVRSGFTLFAPIALVIFFLVFRLKGFWGNLLGFVLVLSLFALGLSGLWASGITEPHVIGGLLPTVDAEQYYHNALQLLNGSRFSDFGSRRPLFSTFLSSLLWISGGNLQISIALMVLLTGLCCYLATKNIRDRFGPIIASFFVVMLFLFYRRFSGTIMSENLGFCLGVLSFSLLFQGVLNKRVWSILLSLFLLSYALNTRAGPFFILPFLTIGTSYYLSGNKNIWRFLLATSAVILLGFILTQMLFSILGSTTGALFSNFSYTLYGLSQGGAGWTRIMVDHPEILSLNEAELSKKIIEFTWIAIKANPWNFIIGCAKQYIRFFNFIKSNISIFSFVTGENEAVYNLTQIFLYLFSIIGLCKAWVNKKQPFFYIILLALPGILLSVPFLIADSSNMRTFAATIPILIIFPTIGIYELINKIPRFSNVLHGNYTISNIEPGTILLSIVTIMFTLLPVFLIAFLKPVTIPPIICPSGQTQIVVDIKAGTYLKIFPNSDFFLDWMPNFHEIRFKTTYISLTLFAETRSEIKQLPSRLVIMSTINLIDNKSMFLIITDQTMFDKLGKFSSCGHWSTSPSMPYVSPFFYAKSFSEIK